MKHTYTTTLAVKAYWRGCEIDGEIEVCAEYTMTPGRAAQTYGPPENCSPAESPEIEIDRIEIGTGDKARPWRPAAPDEAREIEGRLIDECFGEMVDEAERNTADRRGDYEYEKWKDERMERGA